jgi:hypothetical protein
VSSGPEFTESFRMKILEFKKNKSNEIELSSCDQQINFVPLAPA